MLLHRTDMFLSLGCAVLGSGCQVVVPLVERRIVDDVILTHTTPLAPWLGVLIGLGIGTFLFSYVRRYHGGKVALGVQYDLRCAMHDHLQRLDLGTLDTMPTGQLVARANSDSALVQGLLSFFPMMSGNVLLMLLSLVAMVVLCPVLALVSLLVAPTLMVVSYRMRWRIFPATWDAQQKEGDIAQIVDEDVNGVRVVKAFGREDAELTRLANASLTLYGSQMRAVRLQARYQPLLEAIPSLGQVAIVALGGYLALHHVITLGTFLAFSTYIAQMLAPARQLAGVLTIGQQAKAGVDRIAQLLDVEPLIVDHPGATSLSDVGDITFDSVSVRYNDEKNVLDDFTLTLHHGETVALVGESGCGKTTVGMLLSRFIEPSLGHLLIGGHDASTYTLASLRRAVGVASEESFLFSDTVAHNIAYGRPDASQSEIEAAARAACAHEFIQTLPRGYDTVVGERGLTLSGGQRQRVALARALLYAPPILILDDATSSIDATTEEQIFGALATIMKERTTLVMAHRQSTLNLADRIIVMESGRVADSGTHEELFARNANYRSLIIGDEDAIATAGDHIEALAPLVAHTSKDAWNSPQYRPMSPSSPTFAAPSLGGGLGGGSGGGWRRNLAPTPELLDRVAALRPARDSVNLDVMHEARLRPSFELRSLMVEFWKPLALGLLLVVIDAAASLLGPVLVKTAIDNGVSRGSLDVVLVASGIYLVITLADLLDEIGETFITGKAAQRIMLSMRIRIWGQIQRLSLDYYEREMAGRIMTRMTTDVDQLESLIENGLLSALVSLVTFVGVGAALVVLNGELGIATLTVVIPLAVATYFFRRWAVSLYDLSRERIAVVNADFQESLSGVRESQSFVHEEATIRHFAHLGQRYLDSRLAAQRLVALYFPFVQLLSAFAVCIVLWLGASLIAQRQLEAGALIAFILYIDLFFSPIQQLSQVFDSWQQTRISIGRVAQLMAMRSATPLANPARDVPTLDGAITLDSIHFSYPTVTARANAAPQAKPHGERRGPSDPRGNVVERPRLAEALKGISLAIAPGETIALVGETGAGKSTIMKLLARFYDPTTGELLVDGTSLRSMDLAQYRRHLGYVPQEAFLFSGTIADNISYGRPNATPDQIEDAARAVGAHDMVAQLAGGYHHWIVERGKSLSAGHRQLIALARAYLVDPAILLLDEATSNLDLATESKVAIAMQRVAHGRTTVIIAHRLPTARRAHRIFVIDAGQVAESGSHDELLSQNGRYRAMWDAFTASQGGSDAPAKTRT